MFRLVVCLTDEQYWKILMAARELASVIPDSGILLLFVALLSAFSWLFDEAQVFSDAFELGCGDTTTEMGHSQDHSSDLDI